jgi:hypothetical protein
MPRVATARPNGKAIRALRVRQGLSTNQLGKMTGHPPQPIRNLDLRDWPASELFLNRVANALKVDVSELILPDDEDDEADNGAVA